MIKVTMINDVYNWEIMNKEKWFGNIFLEYNIDELLSMAHSNPNYFEVEQ